jgi:hypothetical protein
MQLTERQFRLLQLGLDELARAMGIAVQEVSASKEDGAVLVVFKEKEKNAADQTGSEAGSPGGTSTLIVENPQGYVVYQATPGDANQNSEPSPSPFTVATEV